MSSNDGDVDLFPELPNPFYGVRAGGPKEKRLMKVQSSIPDTSQERMFGLRLENVDLNVPTQVLIDEFSKFGEIGNFFRPICNHTMLPTRFCFVRYVNRKSAETAKERMQGKKMGENNIRIKDSRQNSFFTNDTGFITNEALDTPQLKVKHFDASLPKNHYATKRDEEVKKADEVYTIRISEIPTQIS